MEGERLVTNELDRFGPAEALFAFSFRVIVVGLEASPCRASVLPVWTSWDRIFCCLQFRVDTCLIWNVTRAT